MTLKIHNHSQKENYLSEAEWPTYSAQGHWPAGAVVPGNPGELAHMHCDLTAPLYAEINGPVTCKFNIVLHHFPGKVTSVFFGYHTLQDTAVVVWDATGNSTPPPMIGDPNGDKNWTGHFTVDLPSNVRTWWYLTINAKAVFDNGDAINVVNLMAIWSLFNPTVGDVIEGFLPFLSSRVQITSTAHPEALYGNTTSEYVNLVPLEPFDVPYPVLVQFYSYGSHDLPAATNEIRADLDLHHNIPGVTLLSKTQIDDLGLTFNLEPNVLGQGDHKIALMRFQNNLGEQLSSLLVGKVTVGEGGPPAQTVIVPNVVGKAVEEAHVLLTSIGLIESRVFVDSPLPEGIVTNQSPIATTVVVIGTTVALSVSRGIVAETWRPVTPVFEQLFDALGQPTNRFRITANGKTLEL